MFQIELIEFSILTPLVSLGIMVLLIYMMVYFKRRKIKTIQLLIFLFSMIIGSISIYNGVLPFTPFIQIFFILFQTIFLLESLFE